MCVKLTPVIYCTLNAWIRQPLYMILKTTAVNATPKHCRSFLFMFYSLLFCSGLLPPTRDICICQVWLIKF